MLGRDLVMVPKLIHPLPPNEPRTPRSSGEEEDIEEEPPTPHPLNDTWMQASLFAPLRPPARRWHRKYPWTACCQSMSTFMAYAAHHGAFESMVQQRLASMSQAINEERPPTPPRGRPPNQSNSLAFFE